MQLSIERPGLRRTASVLMAFAVYVVAFALVQDIWAVGAGFFVTIPLIATALTFGLKAGAILGFLTHPTNVLLFYLFGHTIDASHLQPGKITAWGFGLLLGALLGYLRDLTISYRRAMTRLEESNAGLNKALDRVRQLSGLLPICANCKKIRDTEGNWGDVGVYILEHSEAELTHGICPDCMAELYPELGTEFGPESGPDSSPGA